MKRKFAISLLLAILPLAAFAQTSKKTVKKPVKKPAAAKPAPASTITSGTSDSSTSSSTPAKKNERPGDTTTSVDAKKTARPGDNKTPVKPSYPYSYEFTQPAFDIDHIVIEHDDTGKGTVTFGKRDYNESYTDPIQLSAVTMQKLKARWDALNFLDSQENYQTALDHSNMGTIKLRLRRDKRERTAEFNWTENKDAKALMDEYRNLGQQFVWIFDITLARENQPLEAPHLIDTMEAMLKRNEISDPKQLAPLLKDLSQDERIPLLAQNHAAKLLQQIEKEKK